MLRAAIAGMSYAALGSLIDVAIARLDEIDGDPDAEDSDEQPLGGRLGDHPWQDEDAEDGHDAEREEGEGVAAYALDQRLVRGPCMSPGWHRIDQ